MAGGVNFFLLEFMRNSVKDWNVEIVKIHYTLAFFSFKSIVFEL